MAYYPKVIDSYEDADFLRKFYAKNDYRFIPLTPSNKIKTPWNKYDVFHQNSHKVIGQEYDNVIVLLDNNFRYSDDGILQAREHPNPDYLFEKLFYQNITRAREKLCIIVVQNIDLFEKLLIIKIGSQIDLNQV